MDKRNAMRASDADRKAVIGRLGAALAEGRLDQQEHDRRLDQVSRSVTYGDLAALHADLPAISPGAVALARPALGRRSRFLPKWVRVLWMIWLTVVSVAIALWAMADASGVGPDHFWPMWIIVPTGVGLISLSVGSLLTRHERQAAELRRSLKHARRRTAKGFR